MRRRLDTCALAIVMLALMALIGTILTTAAAEDKTIDLAKGKELYQQRCSPCHGPDGKAQTATAKALNPKPRDHTDGGYMNPLSHEHLCKVIKMGGTAVGKSPIMPPQTDLKSPQVVPIIAFVRSLAAPPYTENIDTTCNFEDDD